MTYSKENQIGKYVSFAENFVSKYGKKFLNKGISASKSSNTVIIMQKLQYLCINIKDQNQEMIMVI